VAVTQLGLHETADIYGIALIVLAAAALTLSHQLQDPSSSRGVDLATSHSS
jgi:hypothetical protein